MKHQTKCCQYHVIEETNKYLPVGFPSISTSPIANCPENTNELSKHNYIIKNAL